MAKIIITNAGLAKLANAEQSGTDKVILSKVGLGTGQYTATADMTALKAEFKQLDTSAGGGVGDNVVHLTIVDDSTDTYAVYEVGVYTDDGTLFALYSQSTPIVEKASGASVTLTLDILITAADPQVVEVTGSGLTIPPATTTQQGVVELATAEETVVGNDAYRAVTPASLAALTATTDRRGLVALATASDAGKKTEASKALTPAVIAAAVLNVVYPVGSIYMSTNNVDPSVFIGGTWQALDEGRVLIGANATYKAGSKGGEASHVLTASEMPSHGHSATTNAAGGHTHTRGTMNITGSFGGGGQQRNTHVAGAFYDTGGDQNVADDKNTVSKIVGFDASRTWTGETSNAGSHTHTLTVGKTGGGVAHNNMQPYLAVYMWKRVS